MHVVSTSMNVFIRNTEGKHPFLLLFSSLAKIIKYPFFDIEYNY